MGVPHLGIFCRSNPTSRSSIGNNSSISSRSFTRGSDSERMGGVKCRGFICTAADTVLCGEGEVHGGSRIRPHIRIWTLHFRRRRLLLLLLVLLLLIVIMVSRVGMSALVILPLVVRGSCEAILLRVTVIVAVIIIVVVVIIITRV